MGLFTSEHPDVSSGGLYEHSFNKIERATKSAITNILENCFSSQSKVFELILPELKAIQNVPNQTPRIYIRKDFPYMERTFPLVVPLIKDTRERKAYIGSDDLLYIYSETSEDNYKSGIEVYAGMADVDLSLAVVTTTPDERSMIAEFIYLCFTHFFRTQFIYKGIDQSLFSIVPATKEISMGAETEINDESTTTLIYVKEITLSSFIEYHFRDFSVGRLYELKNINYELNDELNAIEV